MNIKKLSVTTMLFFAVACSIPFTGCSNTSQIQNNFYDYLSPKVTKALQLYKEELPKYQVESSKTGSYEIEIKNAMKPNFTNYSDVYGEMAALVGYWVTDGKTMSNVCYYTVFKDASGNLDRQFTTYSTEAKLFEIDKKLTTIKENQIKLGWSKICRDEVKQISLNIQNLEMLLTRMKVTSVNWLVKQIGQNLYSVNGDNLGIYMDSVATGEWYYNSYNKEVKPYDSQAKNLFTVIDSIDSYESRKTKVDIKPEPIPIPRSTGCSPYLIQYYYINNFGISLGSSRGSAGVNQYIDYRYSKESGTVKELFAKYPNLKIYWDSFEKMGFNVICGMLDLDLIAKESTFTIKNLERSIILRVTSTF